MDFFSNQEVARRNTTKLVVLFALAVVGMISAVYLVVVAVFNFAPGEDVGGGWWHPEVLLLAGGGTIMVVGLGSIYKVAQLRAGGQVVAELMGARQVQPNTSDPKERVLINVVEEMSVASGVPVPGIYIMDQEAGINAFAAGFAPGDAVVAVTRGTLDQLPREELQGVVAHEFSHILNGDMRLNIRLMGVLHGILCIGLAGYLLLRGGMFGSFRSRSSKGNSAAALLALGVGLVVIGYLGMFFAKLIQAAVSRQREFLADSSAVQFTRNPDGLAGALKRIGGFAQSSALQNPQAAAASHMFFGSAIKSSLSGMMATHPPLDERIRRIDRYFQAVEGAVDDRPRRGRPVVAPAAAGFVGASAAAAAGTRTPARMVDRVGQPTDEDLARTHDVLGALPLEVTTALHEPFAARALVFGLLLDTDSELRQAQLDLLKSHVDAPTQHETVVLATQLASIDRTLYLPLVDLAIPALRDMSAGQFDAFSRAVRALIHADGRVDVWEFTLQKVLLRHLNSHFRRPPSTRVRFHKIQQLLDDCQVLLSRLALVGHAEAAATSRAYGAGMAFIPNDGYPRTMLDAAACKLSALDHSLDRIAQSTPGCKQMVLRACAETIAHDGVIEPAEAELLRAIADTLDCPMPPLFEGAGQPAPADA